MLESHPAKSDNKIRLVSPESIDLQKWEALVNATPHPALYGRKWYLDAMTGNRWMALVAGDYMWGIPIMVKGPALLKRVIPPYLCRQMGPYSKDPTCLVTTCLEAITFLKKRFLMADLLVNNGWTCGKKLLERRQNHILWLGNSYDNITKGYNRNTQRNIRKARQEDLSIVKSYNTEMFADFMQAHDPTGIINKIRTQMTRMVARSIELGCGHIVEAKKGQTTVALAFYIEDQDRIYFLLCASDASGKENRAMFLLIDHIIKLHAGTDKFLDFTGSDIPDIARRNEGFGAVAEDHFYLKLHLFTRLEASD